YLRRHASSGTRADVLFNYLGTAASHLGDLPGVDPRPLAAGLIRDPRDRRTHRLTIDARLDDQALVVRVTYSRAVHRPRTMRAIAEAMRRVLRAFADEHTDTAARGLVASDFPAARLTSDELSAFVSRLH